MVSQILAIPMTTTHTATNLRLPVLPWVRKVLLYEFGPEPIRLTGYSLLGKHALGLPFDLPETERPPYDVGGCTVLCSISTRLWSNLQRYEELFQAGYYFEKVGQRMLLSHIVAAQRFGIPAKTAMLDWLDMYDLDEDEYSSEAAYQMWKVYKQGKRGLDR
jgi:hypothetical protein